MPKHARHLAIVTLILSLALAGVAAGQAPTSMVYQGRLLNSAGAPITAATNVVFSIYSAASGGTALWTETKSITPDATGFFTTRLGSSTALGANFFDGTVRYLGIRIQSEASEMTPRQELASTPYALQAGTSPAPHSIDGVANAGGNIDLVAGSGLTITPNDAANTITFTPASGGMHPIAWGMLNIDGTIRHAGSGNWTSVWSASFNAYQITISGLNFNLFAHYAFVQGMGISTGRTFLTDGAGGNLLISPRLHDNTVSQFYCAFAVYVWPTTAALSEMPEPAPGQTQTEAAR